MKHWRLAEQSPSLATWRMRNDTFHVTLAAVGKTRETRLAAQLAVSVQRGRAQRGPASGVPLE